MTDHRTTDEKIEDLLTVYLDCETPEDREAFEFFQTLPDMVKFALLFEGNKSFRKRASDIIWGINEDSQQEGS